MDKLLPCNICGYSDSLLFRTYANTIWWVHCDNCGNIGDNKPTKVEAVEAWNEAVLNKE